MNRISVREMVYHQHLSEQPTAIETIFTRSLSSDEQPYIRKIKVGPEWKKLETGWVGTAGMLLLANDEGKFRQVVPSDKERQEAKGKVLQVGRPDDPWFDIPPGESMRGKPSDLSRMYVRCLNGEARCTLAVLPD